MFRRDFQASNEISPAMLMFDYGIKFQIMDNLSQKNLANGSSPGALKNQTAGENPGKEGFRSAVIYR